MLDFGGENDMDAPCRGGMEAAKAKRERGEELTSDEEQLLDDTAPDPCPSVFGMRAEGLFSPCDVEYCSKCHKLGHVGGLVLLATVAMVLLTQTGLPETYILLGVGVFGLVQHYTIGYLGYYPILGPVLGVWLKPILPQKLKRDPELAHYLPLMSEDETEESPAEETNDSTGFKDKLPFLGSSRQVVEDEDVVFPDDANESDKVRSLKEKVKEERKKRKREEKEKRRIKNEKKETERDVQQKEQQKSQIEQRVSKLEEEKQKAEEKVEFFSHYRRNPANANATPVDVKTANGVKIQGKWVLDWFKMDLRHDMCRGRFWFAIVVDEEELKRGDYNAAPDLMEEDDSRQRYGEKIWPPLPSANADEEVWDKFNPPNFLDAERNHIPERTIEKEDSDGNIRRHTVKEFDEAEPQLFEERIDDVREALADGRLAKLTLLYDEDGVYRGPDYDASSFETRSEWREKARGRKRRLDSLQSEINMMQDEMEDMNRQINIKDQELKERKRRLEKLNEQMEEMSKTVRAQEFANSQMEKRYDRLSAETTELEEQFEKADEQRKKRRREALSEGNRSEMAEVSASRDADVQKAQDAALSIMEMRGYQGNGVGMDIEEIRRGAGDMSRAKAIDHFMNDESVDREDKDKIREVIDLSIDRITEGAV